MSVELFDTHADYEQALFDLIVSATRWIRLFDPDLRRCGLASPRTVAAIEDLLHSAPEARCTILVHDSSAIGRELPRLLDLYRKRSHQLGIRLTAAQHRSFLQPFVTVDDRHFATRFHADHQRGKKALDEPRETALFVAQFETLIEPSTSPQGIEILNI